MNHRKVFAATLIIITMCIATLCGCRSTHVAQDDISSNMVNFASSGLGRGFV